MSFSSHVLCFLLEIIQKAPIGRFVFILGEPFVGGVEKIAKILVIVTYRVAIGLLIATRIIVDSGIHIGNELAILPKILGGLIGFEIGVVAACIGGLVECKNSTEACICPYVIQCRKLLAQIALGVFIIRTGL